MLAGSQVAVRFLARQLVKSQDTQSTQKSRKLLSEKWWNFFGEILELAKEVGTAAGSGRMLCGKRTVNPADRLLVGHC